MPDRVRVAVTGEVPETITDASDWHETRVLEITPPASEQERFTFPVNPLNGVTTIVKVLPLFAPGTRAMLVLLLVSANDGDVVTVRARALLAEMLAVAASVAVIATV